MKYVEFMKRVVPLHDDLFDFFYEALPGYEEVGRRRVLLGCWGSFQNPDGLRLQLRDHGRVGPGDVRHARASSSTASCVTTDLVDINLGMRILLGSSFYDDWEEQRDLRHARIRSATPSISAIRGTRPPSRARRSATSRASTPG